MPYHPKRLLSYVVATDNGFAPHITGKFCTLAGCKPLVRQSPVPGQDLIVGVSTSRHGSDRVIYAMEVNEKIPYTAYFNDPRFQAGKPNAESTRDPDSSMVLVGHTFWYFGGAAPRLPAHLRDTAIAVPSENGRRGQGVASDRALINIFMDWIEAYRPGIHGVPRDLRPC